MPPPKDQCGLRPVSLLIEISRPSELLSAPTQGCTIAPTANVTPTKLTSLVLNHKADSAGGFNKAVASEPSHQIWIFAKLTTRLKLVRGVQQSKTGGGREIEPEVVDRHGQWCGPFIVVEPLPPLADRGVDR